MDPEDEEDQLVNEITFSTGKKHFGSSEFQRLPETYESALKSIPINSSGSINDSRLMNSGFDYNFNPSWDFKMSPTSDCKMNSSANGLSFNYLRRKNELSYDPYAKEIDINNVQFGQEYS